MGYLRELELAYKANEALLLMGYPGVGKTKSLEAFARKQDAKLVTIILSIHEPSDIAGLPMPTSDGYFTMSSPEWGKVVDEAAKQGKRAIIFFDEMTNAGGSQQAAALRVIEDRVLGEKELPKSTWMVAAANPSDIAANGFELSAPLANRFGHQTVMFDPKEFVMNFPVYWDGPPEGLVNLTDTVENARKWMEARGLVASFLNTRPNQTLAFPDDESKRSKAWPSPRTWDKASRILAVANNIEDAAQSIAGFVGDGVAREFITYASHLDLPDPEELLANPSKFSMAKYKGRGDQTFAILSSVHSAIHYKNDPKRYAAAWKIIGEVANSGLMDIGACWARPMARLLPKGTQPPPEVMKFSKLLQEAGIRYGGQ